MNLKEVMAELKSLGTEQTRKTFRRHGAIGDLFGVKIGDLKKVAKKIKGRQDLAMQLWDTLNSDAMYLAALVADGSRMTRKQLDTWAKTATWKMLSEYAVPFVATEHPDSLALARKWMKSKTENIAISGWATYAATISLLPDEKLDLTEISGLLNKVEQSIDDSSNSIRYCMNSFVIVVGAYVKPLLRNAKATAKKIGKVEVDMGDTACKVPVATEMIAKIESMGRVGQKRKTVRC